MGQRAHPGRTAVVCAAASLAALPVLTGCGSSVASATTTLHGGLGATVVHVDGSTRPGVEGLRLRPDGVVRTASGGRAELVTGTRTVYLGSSAALQVQDGARQVLRHGALVADAQRGPGLHLQVAGLDVDTPAGSALRAERSVTTRIAALAGSSEVTSSAGRRLAVAGLHQAMVGGDALPDLTSPLRLTDDDGEAHAIPDLVRDDETLNGLARGIDSTGPQTARVVTAAFGPLTAPRGVGRSERLMPAVIAAAGSADGAKQRYDDATTDRKAGGSWGGVARLVGVRASGVVAALAAFERTQPPGQVGSVAAVLASAGLSTGNRPGAGSNGRHDNGGANGGGDTSGNHNGGGSGGGGSPSPSPSPSGPGGQV